MARLQFYRGPVVTSEAPLFVCRLRQTRTRIGRTDDCDVVLPDDQVSRSHALVDFATDHWELSDRSSNGTWVNNVRLEGRAVLQHGDILRFGAFHARFDTVSDEAAPPTERPQLDAREEEILDTADGIAANEATLVVVRGPGEGLRVRLRGARFSVGGAGSRQVLPDPTLVENHVYVRLANGRAMVEPGRGAAMLGTWRVRDIVPLLPGEDLSIGNTTFHVEWCLTESNPTADRFGEMVGSAPSMRKVFGMLRRMAAHHAPVLLTGESGTGKELAARAIHEASPRAGARFVALNCGSITPTLFESELFGHEKGSFTGADSRRDGAFQRADGGTLFLDELGELPEDAQAKLLRALESGEVRRVGSSEPTFPDVRVVAATNRNLADEVKGGRFRADLYFRLAVLAVRLPPLRERVEDIPLLAETVARAISPELRISSEAMLALRTYSWPGNARELRNVLTRAYVMQGPLLGAEDLAFTPLEGEAGILAGLKAPREDHERELVMDALRRTNQNRSEAARILGIARSSLIYKLNRWGIR